MTRGWAFILALLAVQAASGSDWPMYQHDAARSGMTDVELSWPMKVAWAWRSPVRPQMAWHGPAKRDPYNKVEDLKNRTDFDRVFQPVIADGAVYFGSSATDQLISLDLHTGAIRWVFFTEGPVRFAPLVRDGRVYVGSDDGCVYCVNAKNGQLVWQRRIGPSDERLAGNQRLVSRWPVRTGLVAEGEHLFAGAGMFPQEGVYIVALRLKTGDLVWQSETPQLPAQGYLLASATRLYVPSGRNNPIVFDRRTGKLLRVVEGAGGTYCLLTGDTLVFGPGKSGQLGVVESDRRDQLATFEGNHMIVTPEQSYLHSDDALTSLDRSRYLELAQERRTEVARRTDFEQRLKDASRNDRAASEEELRRIAASLAELEAAMEKCVAWTVPCKWPNALVLSRNALVAGGDQCVALLGRTNGQVLWESDVDGAVYGLALSRNHLVVSTDAGVITTFVGVAESPKN